MKKKKKLLTLLLEGDGKMMKKLLVLMLVFGLASSASAALTLRVATGTTPASANYADVGDEYDVVECENVWIGIYNDTAGSSGDTRQFGAYVNFADTTTAEWYEGASPNSDIYDPPVPFTPTVGNVYYGVTYGYDWWYSSIKVDIATAYVGIGVASGFEFHCVDGDPENDVLITLLDDDMVTVLDTITIHQVPEPATIALLGLGGLFLRRRRK